MLTTAAVILILTIKVALGQDHRVTVDILPLDMALNSSDDLYFGCAANMSKLVETKYLNKERNESPNFKSAWTKAVEKWNKTENNLSIYHIRAIYVYTGSMVYNDFNRNCRTGKQNYIDNTYKWYSLQFLLTEAIQILKKTQKRCHLTYRRTNLTFDENVLNTEVRFGSFASSSLDRNCKAKLFGNESCFEISTCEGADVSKYSKLPEEKEVLIPPYETFIVTGIENNTWCKTVFSLKSNGIKSVLNCAVTLPV